MSLGHLHAYAGMIEGWIQDYSHLPGLVNYNKSWDASTLIIFTKLWYMGMCDECVDDVLIATHTKQTYIESTVYFEWIFS